MTCGIDMATQQHRPAKASRPWVTFGGKPMAWLALPAFAASTWPVVEYGPPPQNQRERQHGCQAEYADADMGLPPADLRQ